MVKTIYLPVLRFFAMMIYSREEKSLPIGNGALRIAQGSFLAIGFALEHYLPCPVLFRGQYLP